MWKFLKDGNNENTGIWVNLKHKNGVFKFILIQEWAENYFSVSTGKVNTYSKKIERSKVEKFAQINFKDKVQFVSAVISYYESNEFIEDVEFIAKEDLNFTIEDKKTHLSN